MIGINKHRVIYYIYNTVFALNVNFVEMLLSSVILIKKC